MKADHENTGSARKPSFKTDLDLKVIKSLRLEHAPWGYDSNGKIVFKENSRTLASGAPNNAFIPSYILWDGNRLAPPGFGVRVANHKTYILRRKVGGKSIMSKVGNVADFDDLDSARKRAAVFARKIIETGRNPNELARKVSAAELTLGQAMSQYREHLVVRTQKPATAETLRVFDRAVRKYESWGWSSRKVQDISMDEIKQRFIDGAKYPSANEQTFRWASRSVRWCIDYEVLAASAERRDPALTADPFHVLSLHGHYRAKAQVDREREEQGKRNPLRPSSTLGPFLEAAWSKKNMNDNCTGIHYLMLMLLWGCRKSEHARCCWGELLPEHGTAGIGRKTTSHVWLEHDEDWGPYVLFHRTKNGRSHRLPIGPMALELLRRRQTAAAEEVARRGFGSKSRQFVFPARSRFSKSGHYSDATDLLDDLREEIGVEKLTRHDLRRSFGSAMTAIDVPEAIKKRFFNHTDVDVTDLYTKAEWALLRQWMERIEQSILVTAPNVYNSLKPVAWPPIHAPAPHICRPPKPRSGRPSKGATKVVQALPG